MNATKTRPCSDCGTEIEKKGRRKYCAPCAAESKKASSRKSAARDYERKKDNRSREEAEIQELVDLGYDEALVRDHLKPIGTSETYTGSHVWWSKRPVYASETAYESRDESFYGDSGEESVSDAYRAYWEDSYEDDSSEDCGVYELGFGHGFGERLAYGYHDDDYEAPDIRSAHVSDEEAYRRRVISDFATSGHGYGIDYRSSMQDRCPDEGRTSPELKTLGSETLGQAWKEFMAKNPAWKDDI